jgi:hypothetical protein
MFRMIVRNAISMMLLAVVSSGAAAEWVGIRSNDTGTLYADPTTIHRKGSTATMWNLYDYQTAMISKASGKPYLSSKSQNEYECEKRQSRILHTFAHSRNMSAGETVYSWNSPKSRWSSLAPDSVDEMLWRLACGKR